MKYVPPSVESIGAKANPLLPVGYYKFRVTGASEKKSKAGNDMIVLTLNIFNSRDSGVVKDYMGDWQYGAIKMSQFSDAVGLPLGELTPKLAIDKTGFLELSHQDSTNPKYGTQNNIKAYLTRDDLIREGIIKDTPATSPAPGNTDGVPTQANSAFAVSASMLAAKAFPASAADIFADELPF
jgi:hypothetical protein